LTSNIVTSGAIQTAAVIPTERISEHSPARNLKTLEADRTQLEQRPVPDTPQVPVRVYNSHGEVIETTGTSNVDTTM
jgi:hypothetical protein